MTLSQKPNCFSKCAYIKTYTGARYVIEGNPCYDGEYHPVWCWYDGHIFEVYDKEVKQNA